MLHILQELRLRPIITGLASNIPGFYTWWDKKRPMGNTLSSQYCLGIWRFHLNNYNSVYKDTLPKCVGELGPGATLGSCIAALLNGIEKSYALDACPYASTPGNNLKILKDLYSKKHSTQLYEKIENAISDLENNTSSPSAILEYAAPWDDKNTINSNSLDLVFSHSVMEHVNSPVETYKACYDWLKPGGIMSHRIDHSSHGITKSFNGHYDISDKIWSIIVGSKPYLLNRKPPFYHEKAIRDAGFNIVSKNFAYSSRPITNQHKSTISNTDRSITTSTFICKKNTLLMP